MSDTLDRPRDSATLSGQRASKWRLRLAARMVRKYAPRLVWSAPEG